MHTFIGDMNIENKLLESGYEFNPIFGIIVEFFVIVAFELLIFASLKYFLIKIRFIIK